MGWEVLIRHKARKILARLPREDKERIEMTLDKIGTDPYSGDIEKMEGEDRVWRRRIGAYRIFYELSAERQIVFVFRIERRASKTYTR